MLAWVDDSSATARRPQSPGGKYDPRRKRDGAEPARHALALAFEQNLPSPGEYKGMRTYLRYRAFRREAEKPIPFYSPGWVTTLSIAKTRIPFVIIRWGL